MAFSSHFVIKIFLLLLSFYSYFDTSFFFSFSSLTRLHFHFRHFLSYFPFLLHLLFLLLLHLVLFLLSAFFVDLLTVSLIFSWHLTLSHSHLVSTALDYIFPHCTRPFPREPPVLTSSSPSFRDPAAAPDPVRGYGRHRLRVGGSASGDHVR